MIRSDRVEMTLGIILQFSLACVWIGIKTMKIVNYSYDNDDIDNRINEVVFSNDDPI